VTNQSATWPKQGPASYFPSIEKNMVARSPSGKGSSPTVASTSTWRSLDTSSPNMGWDTVTPTPLWGGHSRGTRPQCKGLQCPAKKEGITKPTPQFQWQARGSSRYYW
jgi:hypothetical protein